MSRSRVLVLASFLGAAWMLYGALRFDQGLDLVEQGRWVLGGTTEASGTAIHALVDTGAGPLADQVLGAWMRLAGRDFAAAARLQALLHAALAALLLAATLRLGRWRALAVQLALLAVSPLPFAAVWAGLTLLVPFLIPPRLRPAVVFGVLLGLLATQDLAWTLATIVVAAPLARTRWRDALRGLGIAALLVFVQALATGAIGPTLQNSLAGPWSRVGEDGIARIFSTLRSGAWLDLPFAGLATGESLGPAWPGHGLTRALGLRLAGLVVLASPLVLLVRRPRRTGPAFMLSVAAAAFVLLRGDVPGLLAALVLTAAAWAHSTSPRAWIALAIVTAAALPPAMENLWLVTHRGREGLVRWDHERAGVLVDSRRARTLDTALRELHLPDAQPALLWPDIAGLHALLGTRPAVRSLGVGDDEATAAALRASPAPAVLLAADPRVQPQQLELAVPESAAELRHNYRLRGALVAGGLNLRAFRRGASPDDPLATRMPRIECMVGSAAQDLSPALRDELAIGQSFRLERDDFAGFAIRLVTAADSVDVRLRARLWEKPGARFNSLLAARTIDLVAGRDKPMHWVDFPVENTTGHELALVFETLGTPGADVRFAWHEDASPSGIGDVYPGGSALIDLEPIDADLVILIY